MVQSTPRATAAAHTYGPSTGATPSGSPGAQLGTRTAKWQDAAEYRRALAAKYGPEYQKWLTREQNEQLDGQTLKTRRAAKIDESLQNNVQRRASRRFIDRHVSAGGRFRNAPFAAYCALQGVNASLEARGLPALTRLPKHLEAELTGRATGMAAREAWIMAGERFAGIDQERPLAQALMVAPGLRDEAGLQLTDLLISEIGERFSHLLETDFAHHFAAIDALGLAAATALQMKMELIERPDCRQQMGYFARILADAQRDWVQPAVGEPLEKYSTKLWELTSDFGKLRNEMVFQLQRSHTDAFERVVSDPNKGFTSHAYFRRSYVRMMNDWSFQVPDDLVDQRHAACGFLKLSHEVYYELYRSVDDLMQKLLALMTHAGMGAASDRYGRTGEAAMVAQADIVLDELHGQREWLDFYSKLWADSQLVKDFQDFGPQVDFLRRQQTELLRLVDKPESIWQITQDFAMFVKSNPTMARVLINGTRARKAGEEAGYAPALRL